MIESSNRIKSTSAIEFISVAMIIISSGSVYFYLYHAGITLLSILFIASIIAYRNRPKLSPNMLFVTYSFLIAINILIYNLNSIIIGDLIFLIATFLITTSSSYYIFRRCYLNIVLILCMVSLLMHTLYNFDLFTPTLFGTDKEGLHGFYIYFFHVFGGGQYGLYNNNAVAGIFWEPGIYQIILNLCLLINIDLFDKKSKITWRRLKLTIIIITILATKSTTGYLVLGIIIVGNLFQKSKHSIAIKILAIISLFIFWAVAIFVPVISDKFQPNNPSFLVRSNDIIGLFYSLWEHPFIGSGITSKEFKAISDKYGLISMSAGILYQTVQFGIFWLIAFYYSVIKEYKKRAIKIPLYIYIIIITCLGLTEPLAFSPIILMNALPFKRYNI